MGTRGMRMESGEICKEELHILYHLPTMVRVIKYISSRLKDCVVRTEEHRNAFKILRDKPIRKTPLGRPQAYMGEQC